MARITGKLWWACVVLMGALVGCGGEPSAREQETLGARQDALPLLEVVGSVTFTAEGHRLAVGQELCVTATVRDLTANLLANVKVDFGVVGAHATVGSALTNPVGEATFCYSGSVGGQDTITASVGLVTDVTIHVWQAVSLLSLDPKNGNHPVGQQHCVTATVLDLLSLGVPAQRVDFTVTGAHTLSGHAFTNLFGKADFCYTGSVGGQDTIKATVLLLSDTAAHTWLVPNQGPWVSAGPDVSGYSNANIALHGEANDPDGDLLTAQWTYTAHADVDASASCTFTNPNALATAIRCTHTGHYTVKLTVNDGRGGVLSDTAEVTVTNGSNVTMCNMKRYTNSSTQRLCGYATPGKDGAPIADVWFTIDNGEAIHAWPPKPEHESSGFVDTSGLLTEGTHVIRMHALSANGHLSIRTQTVTADFTLPSLTIVSPEANATLQSTVVTVTSSVSDANSVKVTTQYQLTTEAATGTGTVSHTIDLKNRGWQTILVRATDAAGNFVEGRQRVYIQP